MSLIIQIQLVLDSNVFLILYRVVLMKATIPFNMLCNCNSLCLDGFSLVCVNISFKGKLISGNNAYFVSTRRF